MMVPPMLVRMRFAGENHNFRLWLPLVLLAPFVLIVLIILLPFYIIAVPVFWRSGWGKSLLLSGPAVYRVVCALRGLRVDVRGKDSTIYISVV